MTLTQLTALYAALVSTALAAWTIFRDWNDTGKLDVTVGFRSLVGNGPIEDDLLVWSITNVGRRSVLLTHAGGSTRPKPGDSFTEFLVNDPQLPKRLEPGDYHMTICREFDFNGDVTRVYATDSLSRNFYAPKKQVAAANKTIAELRAKGITQSSVRP